MVEVIYPSQLPTAPRPIPKAGDAITLTFDRGGNQERSYTGIVFRDSRMNKQMHQMVILGRTNSAQCHRGLAELIILPDNMEDIVIHDKAQLILEPQPFNYDKHYTSR